jgi:hypothetical protein
MSALRIGGAPSAPASHETMLADELRELERAHASRGPELTPELVRLGAAWPGPTRAMDLVTGVVPVRGECLESIARIGAHLGRLERAIDELPPSEGQALADRLGRARVLVDCAAALAALRASAHEALRTARPA